MRVLIFCQSDDALRMIRAMPGCATLLGGMPEELVEQQIRKFTETEDCVMVATAAFDHGWRAKVEAEIFFMDLYFGSRVQAYGRVEPPGTPAPSVDDMKAMMAKQIEAASVQKQLPSNKMRRRK